jgi:hypothetical protein
MNKFVLHFTLILKTCVNESCLLKIHIYSALPPFTRACDQDERHPDSSSETISQLVQLLVCATEM